MILSCQDINIAFGTNVVLEKVSFLIEEKEKAAIIGVNGAGKTTMFKILMGELHQDSGTISLAKDASLGYMAQIVDFSKDDCIYDEMLKVFSKIINLESKMREFESLMSTKSGAELEQLMEEYSHTSHEFEERKGYEYKSRIRGVLKGLGFSEDEFSQKLSLLSGGEKTRVSLAKILLTEPDLLLLDEPTNHLDVSSIEWLEEFLKTYPNSCLIISHDRYFLDKIVTKIIEIENRKSVVYNGNYTYFAHKKHVDREIALKHYFNQQKDIKRQEEVITKLRSFNREKSIKRAESREKLLDKVERIERPEDSPDKMRINLNPKRSSGFDVLTVSDLQKSFDDFLLFKNVSFDIKKPEKVALIGPNGVGKTTLFKILLDSIRSDGGKVVLGSNVSIGYYDQHHDNIDRYKTIFNEILDSYPRLTVLEIRNALAAFMFTGDDVSKTIETLSGGERGRVALVKIMLGNANFLVLDEPTNHLDIHSKEILEDALRGYGGTVLYISHDRYFINNTADKIIELSKNGARTFYGNYDYYLEKKSIFYEEVKESEIIKSDWKLKKERDAEERKNRNQIQKMETEIENLEAQIAELDARLLSDSVNSDVKLTTELYEKKILLEDELSVVYEKWSELV